jgi:hypothetical protein
MNELTQLLHFPCSLHTMNHLKLRTNVLVACGASESEITELLAYNHNVFDHTRLKLPLTPEPHLAAWEQYATAAKTKGAYAVLKQRLVQFQFPILAGISQTEEYRNATRKGKVIETSNNGLIFTQPEQLELWLHQTIAGTIPVISAGNREDFATLVQALTKRNEPELIPNSMGACIVSGYNNWDRINQYRQEWENQQPNHSETDWQIEFKSLIKQKELYQDQFIILSHGPYSNISASELGISQEEWQKLSLKIRLEHECMHYLTRRLFGSMRNNLLDELIADYRGIVAAVGYYRADWFLHFLGLEALTYRDGGRLQNYRGDPPLSDGAFRILQVLVKKAAQNIECFDRQFSGQLRSLTQKIVIPIALATLTLEELASESAYFLLEAAYRHQKELLFAA